MIRTTVRVSGMACGMCEAHVNDAVRSAFAEEYGIGAYANPTVFTLSDCDATNVTLNDIEIK